jgi:hypothetical protein
MSFVPNVELPQLDATGAQPAKGETSGVGALAGCAGQSVDSAAASGADWVSSERGGVPVNMAM